MSSHGLVPSIMEVLLWCVTMATIIIMVTGLICQFPHCEKVDCEPVTDCNGTVKMGGGYCGCCLACFTYLGRLPYQLHFLADGQNQGQYP